MRTERTLRGRGDTVLIVALVLGAFVAIHLTGWVSLLLLVLLAGGAFGLLAGAAFDILAAEPTSRLSQAPVRNPRRAA